MKKHAAKILGVLLTAIFLLSFTACGKGDSVERPDAAAAPESANALETCFGDRNV